MLQKIRTVKKLSPNERNRNKPDSLREMWDNCAGTKGPQKSLPKFYRKISESCELVIASASG